MLIYLIRHGIPDYTTDSLTPAGALQAEAIAKRLIHTGIDTIYSSPLGRAKETAGPTARALGLEINIEPWMSESVAARSFGGKSEDGKRLTWAFWQRQKLLGNEKSYEDRDSFSHGYYYDDEVARKGAKELEESSDSFLEKLGFKRTGNENSYEVLIKSDRKIAVFAHQGFGLHWLAHLTKIPYHIFTTTFDISHTGLTLINFDERKEITFPQILAISDLSHIYKENLPMKYHDSIDI